MLKKPGSKVTLADQPKPKTPPSRPTSGTPTQRPSIRPGSSAASPPAGGGAAGGGATSGKRSLGSAGTSRTSISGPSPGSSRLGSRTLATLPDRLGGPSAGLGGDLGGDAKWAAPRRKSRSGRATSPPQGLTRRGSFCRSDSTVGGGGGGSAAADSSSGRRHASSGASAAAAPPEDDAEEAKAREQLDSGALRLVAQLGITAVQYIELLEVFRLVDKDGGGTISKDELESLMRTLGIRASKDELEMMVNEIVSDPNKDEIDLDSFITAMSRKATPSASEEQLMGYFRLFDEGGYAHPTGRVTMGTLYQILGEMVSPEKRMKPEDIEDLIRELAPQALESGFFDYGNYINMVFNA